uniref:N-acetyltransferase domain-containing protein n=1 Tax=Haptolina ericina TaxID=156174 RepID=A0A7S3EXF3_9EUKA
MDSQAAAASALDRVAFPPDGLWSTAQFCDELRCERTMALGAWLPCDEGQETLVGMAFTSTVLDETSLTTLAVHPSTRRQGLAEILLRECMASACAAGSQRFLLEVRASNTNAIALYSKCGLSCSGRRKRYYRDNEDALLYDCDLGSSGASGSLPPLP